MNSPASSFASVDHIALALLTGTDTSDEARARLNALLPTLLPWVAPPADVGMLISALAAVRPDAISEEIATQLASVLEYADLSRTAQPAVDEVFPLLGLLIGSPAHAFFPRIIEQVLTVPDLHPRWFWKTIGLLQSLADWHSGTVDVAALISTAERLSSQNARSALFFAVIGPQLLADASACTRELLERACALPLELSEARYVVNALAAHGATPAATRAWAESKLSNWFPLRPVWRRLFGERGLRLLCVQNIADGQGDEIVRVVPLLQALLNDHPETRITLITDRAYLYGHTRLDHISFDEPERIALALSQYFDGLIDFFEPGTLHLNHDTDLALALADYRARHAPRFAVQAAKGWNHFTFDSVRINGFEWADALLLNQRLDDSIYDPTVRLISELGLPLATRTQPRLEPMLAHDPMLNLAGRARSSGRPVALLNPFGGNAELKGFVPKKFEDLVPLIQALSDEGYDVVICPTGMPWGSRTLIDTLLARLPDDLRKTVSSAPIVDMTSASGRMMREMISLVAEADLIVTIEGWMMHAAYLNGKPYRLLLMPASGERDWQPWGRARDQRAWLFQGNPALDRPPCPERPRRAAWLALLNRINNLLWCNTLREFAESPDGDIRRAAVRALGRLGREEFQPFFVALLDDSSAPMRALAAEILLERYPAPSHDQPSRPTLEGYRALSLVPYGGWDPVTRLQAPALPAIRATLHDRDPVMRREAAVVLERYQRSLEPKEVGAPDGS